MKKLSTLKGFTLIELLVVIGILAILLAITLIAINPTRQFQQSNDTKRRSDVNAILNAINQYMADNKGSTPVTIPGTATEIKSTGGVDLCTSLVSKYIAALPSDPLSSRANPAGSVSSTSCASYNTYYEVKRESDNRITVSAWPELIENSPIAVTR